MSDEKLKQFEEFNIKDSITVEGITDDHIWYHSELLTNQMKTWEIKFKNLIYTMEARHKEHIKMLQSVMEENRDLKKQLKEQQK
jgi:uncharacterized membrane protein